MKTKEEVSKKYEVATRDADFTEICAITKYREVEYES